MEPWDGPAALAMTDGRWAVAGLDRNGAAAAALHASPRDGLLIVGSEAGMVPLDETDDRREGPARARAR